MESFATSWLHFGHLIIELVNTWNWVYDREYEYVIDFYVPAQE